MFKTYLKKHWNKCALGLILVYGLILRLLYLGKMPMWIDETLSASAIKAIILHGYPLLNSGSVYFRAWIFSYLSVPFTLLFGINIGTRLVSVIFGVLTIYLAYLFGQKFISKKFGGLAFAVLIAISTIEIIYSKQARFYQMFQFFFFLSFFLFYKFVILKENFFKKRFMDYGALVISILISINLQIMGYFILPLLVLVYAIHYSKEIWLNKRLFFSLCIVSLLVISYLARSLNFGFIKQLILGYGNHYLDYLFRRIIVAALVLGGFIYSLIKNPKFTLSFGLYFILPLVGLFFVKLFATRYVVFALFALFFFIAYLIDKLTFKWAILVLFIVLNMNLFCIDGIGKVNYDSTMPWADWESAYSFIGSNSSLNELPIVSTWTPAAYLYGSSDYWIKYSIGGHSNETWMLSPDFKTERYTNSTLIKSVSEFPSEFILVLDSQASRKLGPSYHEFFKGNCTKIHSALRIWVFECVN